MKFAYFVLPHIGGTYTVFKQLRQGLGVHGIDVRWLGIGGTDPTKLDEWRSEAAIGTMVSTSASTDDREKAKLLVAAILEGGFDGVFVNVFADLTQMNIVRYLPSHILRIMIVHNITPGTYAAAGAVRDHVHATIGVSERCRADLVERHQFDEQRTFAVPNAIDIAPFKKIATGPRGDGTVLRTLFLGRIEDASKGVCWLPTILDNSPPTVRMTIAGSGPDLDRLKKGMSRHSARVRFLGAVQPDRIPDLLNSHDALVMPSRYEGYPLTLVEAMAAGCVPIVSNIRGVTDTIVNDGSSGFLFPVGDCRKAAEIITRLDSHRDLLTSASNAARGVAEQAFTLNGMADRYCEVILSVKAKRPLLAPPLDLENWSLPRGLRAGLRTYVPRPIKNWLRVVRERYRYAPSDAIG